MPELNQEPNKKEAQTKPIETEVVVKIPKPKMNIDKKKVVFIAITVVALFVAFSIGKSSAIDEQVAEARIKADTLYQEIMGQLDDAKSELVNVKTKIKKNQTMIDEAHKYFDEKEKVDNDLEKLIRF